MFYGGTVWKLISLPRFLKEIAENSTNRKPEYSASIYFSCTLLFFITFFFFLPNIDPWGTYPLSHIIYPFYIHIYSVWLNFSGPPEFVQATFELEDLLPQPL